MSLSRKRFVVVGTGGRAVMFLDALAGEFREMGEIVGLCDVSRIRMAWHNARLASRFSHPAVATFLPAEFDTMIARCRADTVIVTTMDCTHHHYVIRAMELGCDVICEKPLTTDAQKARAILDTVQRTGRKLQVTFNMRYMPPVTRVMELMRSGVIGSPTAVDFSWVLDTRHGADYFRRWHREKDKSGGLLVHKSTHHFDLVNWWIGSYPKTVFAMGGLKFYGRNNAESRGEKHRTLYSRYTGEPAARNDPFALSLESEDSLRGLYLNAEADSGYVRDRNVFGDNITSEDTLAVMARYHNGVVLNYSLICYSPWEGWRAAITGTKGRIEVTAKYGSHIVAGQSDAELAAEQQQGLEHRITVHPMFEKPFDVEIPSAEGGHGGGDPLMLQQLFNPGAAPPDPCSRAASHIDGAASILLGISANESMETGLPVNCNDLIPLPSPTSQPAQRCPA
jgi:predicted dehydrogenase